MLWRKKKTREELLTIDHWFSIFTSAIRQDYYVPKKLFTFSVFFSSTFTSSNVLLGLVSCTSWPQTSACGSGPCSRKESRTLPHTEWPGERASLRITWSKVRIIISFPSKLCSRTVDVAHILQFTVNKVNILNLSTSTRFWCS